MAREHETTANTYLVTWTVEPGDKYRKLSREYLQRAIKEGRVTLNDSTSKAARLLKVGEKVNVLSTRGKEPKVDFGYTVLFEDNHILVVDKPGNLPVHPTGRYFFHTLLTQLRVENGNEVNQKKEFWLVHRIDRETSGVMVLGKNAAAASDLTRQWEKRETSKEYLAIVNGRVEQDSFEVDAPLGRHTNSQIKLKMNVVEMGSDGEPLYLPRSEVMPSRTGIEVVERLSHYTVVRCKPHTGRQHQIRVHLWHVGHPICGDKLYGPDDEFFLQSTAGYDFAAMEVEPGVLLTRHALHAHKLGFRHPVTGEYLEFQSPLPPELAGFLEKVR
jgi:23S rRNA pseudouridine1911/1915/1917 synthase